ncbi:hypothetical protein [Streptomyces chilikensis]|uniref:hypothetical protein n=1 Tax=Streptomyces chilikensis TaxID=1194079 RepID=UPI00140721FB|nr:hypothetical protein [Streptomyces chilikensis]
MGSLRNPVGPLPSSIYWRRRVVFFVVLLALAGLAVWLVTGGGGGSDDNAGGPDGKNPAPSITPGPSGSGPAIDDTPGGRDESGEGGSGDSSEGASSGGGSGDAAEGAGSGEGGDGSGGGSGGAGGTGGTGGGSGSGGSSGTSGDGWTSSVSRLPGNTDLASCGKGDVRLSLRSVRNTYEDDEKPVLRLTVSNTSGDDCKIDLGPRATVLKITKANAEDDETYWSSADCPEDGALLFRVPKGGSITYDVEWDRRPSDSDKCEAAPKGSAGAGTYLVVARSGATSGPLQATFTLKSD